VCPSLTFNAEESLKAITNERVTTLYGTPTMFIDLYSHPNFKNYDMSSLDSGIIYSSIAFFFIKIIIINERNNFRCYMFT
jgi:acyl-CoA synthetase (AMP-forming)/AMP-acid ligase II